MKAKQKKVLQVVGAMNRAGTETMLMNLYRHFDHDKVQFDFVSYSEGDAHYDSEIRDLGGRIIRLTKTNSIKALYDVMKRYGPYDAIHAHTLFHSGLAVLAGKLAGVRIRISHAHTTDDDSVPFKRKVYQKMMRPVIRVFSTDLLACSNGAANYLFGTHTVRKKGYTYFPNVIDYQAFLPVPFLDVKQFKMREAIGNCLVIGHIGRFIEAKNHTFILEIMKRILDRDPTMKLLLVGDGDGRKEIEKLALEAGLLGSIRFVGVRSDIATMLHSMDVFLFPSIYEGLGLVLLEAQASGLPCVVSDAIQDEADIGIGLVSKLTLNDSPDVWADHLLEVIQKREFNTGIIKNAFEQNGFCISTGIAKLMKRYQIDEGDSYEQHINSLI